MLQGTDGVASIIAGSGCKHYHSSRRRRTDPHRHHWSNSTRYLEDQEEVEQLKLQVHKPEDQVQPVKEMTEEMVSTSSTNCPSGGGGGAGASEAGNTAADRTRRRRGCRSTKSYYRYVNCTKPQEEDQAAHTIGGTPATGGHGGGGDYWNLVQVGQMHNNATTKHWRWRWRFR